MNAAAILSLVDRGLAIVAQQKELDRELKAIEAELKKAGLAGDHQELKDSAREGRQYLARGSRSTVPVIFTADLLVKSFAPESKEHTRIAAAAAGQLAAFFELVPTYKAMIDDGKEFRDTADKLLGEAAPAFITACLQRGKGGVPKSAVKIEWDKALTTAGEAATLAESEVAK